MELNSATPRELQRLPGVGCVIARLIIEARPFVSVEDLLRVKGIGPVKFAAITELNQVYVDEKSSKSTLTSKPTVNSSKIDLNAASKRQLLQLKGVGPVLAQRIVEARPFHRKEDLLAVQGIGTKSYVKIQVGAHVKTGLNSIDKDENRNENIGSNEEQTSEQNFHICREIESDETFLLQRIADVLEEFDLVALQEVRDLIVLKRLKTMLPGWNYVVSEPVGRKSPGTKKRAERYAFFYRPTFRATEGSGLSDLELLLMNVHVSFAEKESRHAEIEEINRLAKEVSETTLNKRKVVVLGDFNLSPQDVLGSLGSRKMALIRSPLSTTVFGKLYDNIWLDRSDFSDEGNNYLVNSGVLRVDWRYYPLSKGSRLSAQNPMDAMLPRLQTYMSRVQCGYELSDHCPVWVALQQYENRTSRMEPLTQR
ncbi:Competence protein ComEA helix-hairpin-helix repeat protein [Phytophthora megakarya]|uniref:Endonuclease/exonuclease/phosphatase family domain-containing protein 1 n=1 Tax=Phytophthora megakarya TaxID=4795 RepID=A0A225W7Q0_9STRA|nr:Competence protein ComEA helix-hairpin-helix repeat protein [Phytophthora megakarya]